MISQIVEFKSYESDVYSRVKLSAIMKHFQQLAREDLDRVGCTYPSMRERNVVFVLVGLSIDLKKPLMLYKNYKIETVPRKIAGIRFIRDFYIYDGEEIVCEAVSSWVLIDFVSRRPLRPSTISSEIPHDDSREPKVQLPIPIKQNEFYDYFKERTVYYSMLDENNHLNNCNYADLIEDSLPDDCHKRDIFISHIEINYVNEAKLSSILKICISNTKQSEYEIFALNKTTEKECFSAKITFSNFDIISVN